MLENNVIQATITRTAVVQGNRGNGSLYTTVEMMLHHCSAPRKEGDSGKWHLNVLRCLRYTYRHMGCCDFENNNGNILENVKHAKSYTFAAKQWTCWGRGQVGPGWTQAGRRQEHGNPAGHIITHPDGAATWYSLHIHKNIPALDKSMVREWDGGTERVEGELLQKLPDQPDSREAVLQINPSKPCSSLNMSLPTDKTQLTVVKEQIF